MLSMLRKKENGFSLIELMTVLAVIGLLATIAIPTFLWYLKRARNAFGSLSCQKCLYNCPELLE